MSVCPFAQRRLDEAFGLAVGFGRAGLGSDVSETRVFADPRKVTRSVAEAVVGHDGLDLHAQLCVVGNRGFEEGYGAALLLVGLDLGERDTRVVVDANTRRVRQDWLSVYIDEQKLFNSVSIFRLY